MARVARAIPEQGYLHIINRGNNKRKVFRYHRDKQQYYRYLKYLKGKDKIDIYHYCIMSNHIHLLVGINPKSNISKFMQRLNLKYTYYHKRKYNYCGYLWQGRFRSKIIDDERYFLQCGKYIELNPVRAGIVLQAQNYQFSSYNYYAFGAKDSLISENPLYKELGLNKEQRQDFYRILVAEEVVKKDFL